MPILGNMVSVAGRAMRNVAPDFGTNPMGFVGRKAIEYAGGLRGVVNGMGRQTSGDVVMNDQGRVNGSPATVETLPPTPRILGGLVRSIGDSAIPQAPGAIPGALPRRVGLRYPNAAPALPGTGVKYRGQELGRDASGGLITDQGAVDDQGMQWHDLGGGASATNATAVTRDAQGRGIRRGFADPRASIAQRTLGVGSVTPQGGIITGATVGDMDRSSTPLAGLRSPAADFRAKHFTGVGPQGPVFNRAPSRQERLLGIQGDQAMRLAGVNNASAERIADANNKRQLGIKRSEWQHDLDVQESKNRGLKESAGRPIYDDEGNIIGISGRGSLAKPGSGTTAGDANVYKTTLGGIDTRRQELIRQRGIAEKNAGWFTNKDEQKSLDDIDAQIADLNEQEKALIEAGVNPAPRAGIKAKAKPVQEQAQPEQVVRDKNTGEQYTMRLINGKWTRI